MKGTMEQQYSVYILIDPWDKMAWYVGTSKNVRRRSREHLQGRSSVACHSLSRYFVILQRVERFIVYALPLSTRPHNESGFRSPRYHSHCIGMNGVSQSRHSFFIFIFFS